MNLFWIFKLIFACEDFHFTCTSKFPCTELLVWWSQPNQPDNRAVLIAMLLHAIYNHLTSSQWRSRTLKLNTFGLNTWLRTWSTEYFLYLCWGRSRQALRKCHSFVDDDECIRNDRCIKGPTHIWYNCQRPVVSLGVSQPMHKITNLWTFWTHLVIEVARE